MFSSRGIQARLFNLVVSLMFGAWYQQHRHHIKKFQTYGFFGLYGWMCQTLMLETHQIEEEFKTITSERENPSKVPSFCCR